MILVSTDTLKPGKCLAMPVYTESEFILISEKVPLTERMIKRLIELGISYVYVEDERTKDIKAKKPISDQLRKEAKATIENQFNDIQKKDKLAQAVVLEKTSKELSKVIRSLLFEIKSNKDLITLLSDVITYDNYIFSHSLNVTLYSLAIGAKLNLSVKELEILGLGAILHDVGKMSIPTDILMKNGKLTEEEYEIVKAHTSNGFEILRSVQTIPLIASHCAYQHHERLDGSGYPRGIKGNDIHYFARIIAVADVFDAVTSNRIYRNAMLPHEGLEILYAGVGQLYDAKIIEAFRRAVVIYPLGLTIVLNDGRKGVVSKQNQELSERPVVRIIEENNQVLDKPYEVDLMKELHLIITACDPTMAGAKEQLNK
ncbi:HD-GYP domain-containing protein [Bacillus sp. PS06]|uniref:HD-GYP domain-containing protein n=1 Tax=Bacillus sp. PS06 TaxID=2764176 RepID=UPI00178516A8|nr:HD-GYP domain-containing protein [Bacillus sp. PS06]MBD8070442.1 HD-GYP domain-containing protein [Bacillus sp. PS06]